MSAQTPDERLESIRERWESGILHDDAAEDVAWLLAEVAHLTEERDDARAAVGRRDKVLEAVRALAADKGPWKGEKHVRITGYDRDLGCAVTESYIRVDDLRAALDTSEGAAPSASPHAGEGT